MSGKFTPAAFTSRTTRPGPAWRSGRSVSTSPDGSHHWCANIAFMGVCLVETWVVANEARHAPQRVLGCVSKALTKVLMLDGNDGPHARATARTPCILVVEDEDLVRDLAMRVLTLHGYRVLAAENGRVAVDVFDKHAGDIDLVLLDLTMPGLNGAQVFAAIVARRPDARVLITSGYSEDEGRELLAHPAVAGFLAKPYRIDALVERVQN